MPEKTPGKSRNRKTKAPAPDEASAPALVADRYIADQLKAIYDAVVAEPVPDRLLQLLDRLDGDPEK
jgi:Anti-sigma factor NepR